MGGHGPQPHSVRQGGDANQTFVQSNGHDGLVGQVGQPIPVCRHERLFDAVHLEVGQGLEPARRVVGRQFAEGPVRVHPQGEVWAGQRLRNARNTVLLRPIQAPTLHFSGEAALDKAVEWVRMDSASPIHTNPLMSMPLDPSENGEVARVPVPPWAKSRAAVSTANRTAGHEAGTAMASNTPLAAMCGASCAPHSPSQGTAPGSTALSDPHTALVVFGHQEPSGFVSKGVPDVRAGTLNTKGAPAPPS